MATSFSDQFPSVIHILTRLKPRSVLDIGKGFGKYGFLIHEYCGIDPKKAPNPSMTLRQQSTIVVDAVDINRDYDFPHLSHLYSTVHIGDILQLYPKLPNYDLILMADVIEHLPKESAKEMLRAFIAKGSRVLVTTPVTFFQQELYESDAETHVSFWTTADFGEYGCHVQWQKIGAGAIYLLSPTETVIRGFGSSPMAKLRRLARAIRAEI